MASDGAAAPAVDITPIGPAACAAVTWRMGGRTRVSIIVKVTLRMSPDAPMVPAAPEPVLRADLHHKDSPTQSLRATSELAPYLPKAEVTLTGHACAPQGERVPALAVRLAVYREDALVDKTIHVHGDRKGGEPQPFDRIPLVLERAIGGLGSSVNPFGTGEGGRGAPPNLLDPVDPARPACFSPLPRSWPARRRLLGKLDPRELTRPLVEIPDGFDWDYFHAAPSDQRLGYLQGDEWIVLEGMHPAHEGIQSRLPHARAQARVYGVAEGGGGQRVTLAADTLRIDADELLCWLVFRHSFVVPSEETLAALHVDAGVELSGEPIAWPAPRGASGVFAPPSVPGAPAPPSIRGANAPPSVPGAKAPPSAPAMPTPSMDWEGTLDLPGQPERRRPLPFAEPPAVAKLVVPPPAPPPPRPPGARGRGGTVTLALDASQVQALRAPPAPPDDGARGETLDLALGRARVQALRDLPFPAPGGDDEEDLGATLPFVSGDARAEALQKLLPFASSPSLIATAGRTAPVVREIDDDDPFMGTLAFVDDAAATALPFITGAPTAPRSVEPAPAPAPAAARTHRTALGIRLVHEGPLAVDVVPWGLVPSRDVVAVVAKATCDLVPGGPAAPRPEAEPQEGDDRVPFKVRADIVLVGRASAPGGSATSMDVALRFGEGAGGFERRIRVFGDRTWEKVGAAVRPSAPEPFAGMPVVYERAYGGPRFAANPAGVGQPDPMRRGPSALPNLEDPERLLRSPKQPASPMCFAPVPPAWRERERHLCLADEALDWARFQAAPRAQRLAFLRGDERFTITGMHPSHPVLEGALPGLRARAFALFRAGALGGARCEEVALRLDTAALDAGAMTLTLVWRGAVPVADEQEPGIEAILFVTEKLGAEGLSLDAARATLLRS